MFTKKEKDLLRVALAQQPDGNKVVEKLDSILVAFNSLLAKLDQDTGVTDEDYESTLG